MSRHVLNVHYVDVLPVVRLIGGRLRELCGNAVLTVTGYLRPRPDPAAENALRRAFTDLDRELAEILGDRRVPRGQARPLTDPRGARRHRAVQTSKGRHRAPEK